MPSVDATSADAGTDALLEDGGGRLDALAAHLLAEAGELSRPLDERRTLHERAAALLAADVSDLGQLAQRLADRDLAHLEALGELVLRREAIARAPLAGLDPAQDRGFHLVIQGNRQIAAQGEHELR